MGNVAVPIMSQRSLAKFLKLSPTQVARLTQQGLIHKRPDGFYDQREAVLGLLQNYRQRLTIAETLCRKFMGPYELHDWYRGNGVAF